MKKRFINEPLGFCFMLFLTLLYLSILFLALKNAHNAPNPTAVIITFSILFGTGTLLCLVVLIMKTEFISIQNKRIECRQMFRKKHTVIYFSEIKAITEEGHKCGIEDSAYPCWKIDDHLGNSIFIVQTKSRKKIIEHIREQINANL